MNNEIYLPKVLQEVSEIERTKFANTPFVCHHTPENRGPYFQYLVIDLRLSGYDYFLARFRVLDNAIVYAQSIR